MIVFLLERFLGIVCGLYIITQLIIPSFIPNLEYNWMFKSDKKLPSEDTSDLHKEVEENVERFKEVKTKVETNLKDAQDLKSKTDNV